MNYNSLTFSPKQKHSTLSNSAMKKMISGNDEHISYSNVCKWKQSLIWKVSAETDGYRKELPNKPRVLLSKMNLYKDFETWNKNSLQNLQRQKQLSPFGK